MPWLALLTVQVSNDNEKFDTGPLSWPEGNVWFGIFIQDTHLKKYRHIVRGLTSHKLIAGCKWIWPSSNLGWSVIAMPDHEDK